MAGLPRSAFIRNLPRCLQISERLRLEAIVSAANIVEFSLARLSELLELVAIGEGEPIAESIIIETTLHSWSIVDQAHNILQLFRNEPKLCDDEWAKFELHAREATALRNAMDHIHSNLGNMARKTSASQPLHGWILFATRPDANGALNYISFPLGKRHHVSQVSPTIDTWIPPPRAFCLKPESAGIPMLETI